MKGYYSCLYGRAVGARILLQASDESLPCPLTAVTGRTLEI